MKKSELREIIREIIQEWKNNHVVEGNEKQPDDFSDQELITDATVFVARYVPDFGEKITGEILRKKYLKSSKIKKPNGNQWPIIIELDFENQVTKRKIKVEAIKMSRWLYTDYKLKINGKEFDTRQSNKNQEIENLFSTFLGMDELDKFENELKKHDWWYEMSDDNRAWNSGLSHKKILDKMYSDLPERKAKELWNKYAPKEFKK